MKVWFKNLDKGWIVAALLPLIGILPAFHVTSVIDTADGLFHVHRIVAMTELMAAGDLYPRWIPWFHLGYGYPVFNFYAPAASYLGGLLGLIGISPPLAYNLIAAVCWVGGGLGMYALACRFLHPGPAIVAVALWSYAPSRLQDVWNIGNLSGFIGTALLPWLFFALVRAIDRPSYRSAAWLAIAFGGVLLAHQPTTVLATLVVFPGVPILSLWESRRAGAGFLRRLLLALGGLALGGGIAMIFLLPTLAEVGYIKVSLEATDIPSVLGSGFLLPGQLFMHPAAPDLTDISRGLPDTFGLVGGLLAVLGFLALIWRRRVGLALACAAVLLFCIFLLLDVSFNFWLAVPLLDQLRFPARVLRLGVVFLSLLGGASLLLMPARFRDIAAFLAVILVIGAALPTIYPSRDRVNYDGITPLDAIRYEQATYAFGGTSYNEFKPIWAVQTPYDTPPDVESYAADPMQVRFIDPQLPSTTIESIGDSTLHVTTVKEFELSFRHFYFPGWTATLDGETVEVYPATEFGLSTVTVPPGDHTITLYRHNTPVEHLAALLTVISLGITVVLLRKHGSLSTAPAVAGSERLSPRLASVVAGGIVVFAILNLAFILPGTDWFRLASPPDNPAAMQTAVRQPFGDAYELLGYTLHQQTVIPGGTFRITLFWRALRPLDHTYRPLVQLNDPALTRAWASNEGFFIGASPLIHKPAYFTSDIHNVAVFDDAPPYLGHITVQLIDPQTNLPLPLPDGSQALTLPDTVRILAPNPAVQAALDYTLGDTVVLRCASVESTQDELAIDLYWQVIATPDRKDLRVFIHGLDASGEMVQQADNPPLDGAYLPVNWLPGQTLHDHFTLPDNRRVDQIAIGLYTSDGTRLPVMRNGESVPDGRILLERVRRDCAAGK